MGSILIFVGNTGVLVIGYAFRKLYGRITERLDNTEKGLADLSIAMNTKHQENVVRLTRIETVLQTIRGGYR